MVSGTLWDRFFRDFGTTFGSLEGPWDVLKTSGLDIDFQENLEMAGESSESERIDLDGGDVSHSGPYYQTVIADWRLETPDYKLQTIDLWTTDHRTEKNG